MTNTEKVQNNMFIFPPSIKNRDKRCSTRCYLNFTKFNSRPPIGHFCECNFKTVLSSIPTRSPKEQS